VLGGIVGAGAVYLIASGKAGFDVSAGLASNGYGAHFFFLERRHWTRSGR
jgi:aquaporin Z